MSFRNRFRNPLSIAIAFVSTHNHLVLDRGGNVFKQTAPLTKLPNNVTEDDHLGLVGALNSSVACSWMKQTFMDRGHVAMEVESPTNRGNSLRTRRHQGRAVSARCEISQSDLAATLHSIVLIERPEYKRRWSTDP